MNPLQGVTEAVMHGSTEWLILMDLGGFDLAQITKGTEMTDTNIDLSQIGHGGNQDKRNPV